MAELVDDNTVLVIASAPSYPHGVVDDVREVALLAETVGVLCHVDACVGGMVLPFARSLGSWSGEFDFSLSGVTSMSVDLHKFGYTAKGASVVLYRSADLFSYQGFTDSDWTGGKYEVPNLTGTRPGGAITAAWAAMRYLGQTGYCELTRQSLEATRVLREGIGIIDGLHVVTDPDINLMAIGDEHNRIRIIASELIRRGWVLGTQGASERGEEQTIHLTVTAGHRRVIGEFLGDLALAAEVGSAREAQGETATDQITDAGAYS
jgi:glutamate/tyrosine decarboxylase-like PLP-dependent enzyme